MEIPKHVLRCHLCDSEDLTVIDGYEDLKRVTSDAKPWRKGGRLAFCGSCATAQAIIDRAWQEEAAAIYADYGMYLRSGGNEQVVFDAHGTAYSRSDQLFRRMKEQAALPAAGDVLDIGCSNGGTLRSFSSSFPQWRCHGHDLNNRFEAEVRRKVDLHGFFTGTPAQIPRAFDLATMFHVLEHIPAPRAFLREVRSILSPQGMLFIEVPNCALNPFILLVADHSTHFWDRSLGALLESAGFQLKTLISSWVSKELSALAVPNEGRTPSAPGNTEVQSLREQLRQSVQCLRNIRNEVRQLRSESRPFGLFGTAIAATWLLDELEGDIDFFVDEDQLRVGKTYFDKPIVRPAEVSRGATVYLPFAPEIARSIRARLEREGIRWVTPSADNFPGAGSG